LKVVIWQLWLYVLCMCRFSVWSALSPCSGLKRHQQLLDEDVPSLQTLSLSAKHLSQNTSLFIKTDINIVLLMGVISRTKFELLNNCYEWNVNVLASDFEFVSAVLWWYVEKNIITMRIETVKTTQTRLEEPPLRTLRSMRRSGQTSSSERSS